MSETKTSEPVVVTSDNMVKPAIAKRDATAPVLLGRHHDISAFASSDPTRYTINSVHYNAAKGVIEATDGKMMIRVPVCKQANEFPQTKGGDAALADVSLPVAPFKKALGNVLAKSVLPALQYARLSSDSGGKATLVTTDLDTEQAVTLRCVDVNYVNLDQDWPTKAPTLRIALGSKLLKTIAEYAERHGREDSGGHIPIIFEFNEPLNGVRFSFTLDDAMGEHPRAEGVLMPIRIE